MADAEPRLSRALIARLGRESGREATVDALVYGWRNWAKVRKMRNPVGYLYRVGVTSVKPTRSDPVPTDTVTWEDPWIEPRLDGGLASLTDPQKTAVVLFHSFSWTHEEIASLLGVSVSTVRNHLARGMRKLRAAMRVPVDG